MLGAAYAGQGLLGVAPMVFYNGVTSGLLGVGDVMNGLIKSVVFGIVMALASCQYGLGVKGGAPGVGRAVNATVVASAADAALRAAVAKKISAEYPSLEAIYRDLHAHPELSFMETRTAALVAKELRATLGVREGKHAGRDGQPKPFEFVDQGAGFLARERAISDPGKVAAHDAPQFGPAP